MGKYTISLDVHKRFTRAGVEDGKGSVIEERTIRHERGAIRDWLRRYRGKQEVAFETVGNWYWIADEIEEAGKVPLLVNAGKARRRIAETNKSDSLDVRGLNMLQRCHALPTVWIPPRETRDLRELTRVRMTFTAQRVCLKNVFHAALAKHGLKPPAASDIFGPGARDELRAVMEELPDQARFAASEELDWIDHLGEEVAYFESRIAEVFEGRTEVELIDTLPGVGLILGVVIWVEVGDVNRFASPARLATYSGTTPRLIESGGKKRLGHVRKDVNHYLKWAFVEAANVVCMGRNRRPSRHTSRLYERVRRKRNHFKAIVAVARHLAESTYWILKKREPYREPGTAGFASTRA